MTTTELKTWHDLLDALAAGELEINEGPLSAPAWRPVHSIYTANGPECYRRKPKPREFTLGYSPSRQIWKEVENPFYEGKTIRVREIID